jgi:LuxR family transcriptional regulator, maltose regulon positive regulatory protein
LTDRLLSTKYEAPPVRLRAVVREELLARLEAGFPLTVVCAPAGYGKTTLVADWAARAKRKTAWLTLDDEDSDPAVFVAYLSAAVRQAIPALEVAAFAGLGATNPRVAIVPFLNSVAQVTEPLTIVLDDYHFITGPQVHELVAFLVGHLPRHVRLVILGRQDPPLPVARLRARGQLAEIRAHDLCFDSTEANRFFAETLQLDLAPETVDRLTARTEGWPAGLQLAGLSLQAGSDPTVFLESFGATDRFVLDYLSDEVLASLPAEIRHFLGQTSVLERLCAPLCDALTGRNDGAELLAVLERSNLFLVALDERRQWYRYHALFADTLRAELRVDEQAELRGRAAAWLAKHELVPEAIRQSLAGGLPKQAAELIESVADQAMARGEYQTILRWCDLLSAEVLAGRPSLRLIKAWSLFFHGNMRDAFALSNGIEAEALDPSQAGRLLGLRAWLGNRLDLPNTEAVARQAAELMPESDGVFRSLALLTLGETLVGTDAAEALATFDEAAEAYRSVGSAIWCALTGNRAQTEIILGRRSAAEDRCRRALEDERASQAFASGAIGLVHAALGMSLFEAGAFAEARQRLTMAREQAERAGLRMAAFGTPDWYELLSMHATGDAEGAWSRLESVRREAERIRADRVLCALPFMTAELALRDGDVATVARLDRELPASVSQVRAHLRDLGPQVRARLKLCLGKPEDALAILEPLAAWQRASRREGRLIATLVLQGGALDALGHELEARLCIEEAVSYAAPETIRRPFLEERELAQSWLPRLRDTAPVFVQDILERLGRSDAVPHRPRISPTTLAQRGDELVEPLSARELDVLRLVAAGLSNDEIGRELYIGTGTTKWHVHNLLGKVGARDRVNLVKRARELGLVT